MKLTTPRTYQICTNCIMDTTDPNITFDERGWCDYCRNYYKNILPNWHTDARGEKELLKIAEKIKKVKTRKTVNLVNILEGYKEIEIISPQEL